MPDSALKLNHKIKTAFPAEHVINWYLGNYLESPNNEIRDESFDIEKKDWKPIWFDDIEKLRKELNRSQTTHIDFIRLVKKMAIHAKYYRYRKYENSCEACSVFGIE